MTLSTLTVRCQTCGTSKPSTDGWGGTVVYCTDCAKNVGSIGHSTDRPTRPGVIDDDRLTQNDNPYNLKYAVVDSEPDGVLADVTTPDYMVGDTLYRTGLVVDADGHGHGYAWPVPVTRSAHAHTATAHHALTVTATRTVTDTGSFTVEGLPAYAAETRDRIRAAITNAGETWPTGEIAVHVGPNCTAPSSSFDLAAACAVLATGDALAPTTLDGIALIAELGLDGRTRPVAHVNDLLDTAKAAGYATAIVATDDMSNVDVAGISVHDADSLRDALDVLRTLGRIK
ncbi:magnesium chelatase domain-containing protein [Streptomyces sp. NPDC005395]|uniref:magnesium chelatase domain-containing protein n=1 Tax=Streptomyces sp. NPDC005395 TaxID=3157042 RepID=UPI0033BA9772